MSGRVTHYVIQYPELGEERDLRITQFTVQYPEELNPPPPPIRVTQFTVQYIRQLNPPGGAEGRILGPAVQVI